MKDEEYFNKEMKLDNIENGEKRSYPKMLVTSNNTPRKEGNKNLSGMEKNDSNKDADLCKIKSKKFKFAGYASCFDVLDSQNDIVAPGTFSSTIHRWKKGEITDIKLLWQHDAKEAIGLVTHLQETPKGLWMVAEIILETNKGREAAFLVQNKIVRSLSIGYTPTEWRYSCKPCNDGPNRNQQVRIIKDCRLWEISCVTFAANSCAQIVYPNPCCLDPDCDKDNKKKSEINIDIFQDNFGGKKSNKIDGYEKLCPLDRETKDVPWSRTEFKVS